MAYANRFALLNTLEQELADWNCQFSDGKLLGAYVGPDLHEDEAEYINENREQLSKEQLLEIIKGKTHGARWMAFAIWKGSELTLKELSTQWKIFKELKYLLYNSSLSNEELSTFASNGVGYGKEDDSKRWAYAHVGAKCL